MKTMATVDLTLFDDSDDIEDDCVQDAKRLPNRNRLMNDDHDSFDDPDYNQEDDDEEDDDEENCAFNANDSVPAVIKGQRKQSTTEESSTKATATPKHKKNPLVYRNPSETPPGDWTDAEVKALVGGVVKHDKGQWVTIKRDAEFAAALARRTTTAMASKYYQICKRQENRRKREKKRAEREREREERKKQPRKKPRARMNWTPEEDEALLAFVAKYGQQWVKIKSENVILEPPPINVNRTRGGLCNRYKCLMEQKKNVAEGIVRWTDKLDKKLLVLAIVHEQDWRIVADEFSSSSTDAKATTQNVQPSILQARYAELLDAVVKGNKESKDENSRIVKQEKDSKKIKQMHQQGPM